MPDEEQFLRHVATLDQSVVAQRIQFWSLVSRFANKEGRTRDLLERHLPQLWPHILKDLSTDKVDLISNLVLALGYCVARPQLLKHLELTPLIARLTHIPRSFGFAHNKAICIKCLWALANIKKTDGLKQSSESVLNLIADMLIHRGFSEDVTVHKEVLRLVDRMLGTAPDLMCSQLGRWLLPTVNLTANKLQLIREKALTVLKSHCPTMLKLAADDVNGIMEKPLFGLTKSSVHDATSPLLIKLQELATQGHSGHVFEVWVLLIQMTTKCIRGNNVYVNELFKIPKFIVTNLDDDTSKLDLLNAWIHAIDIIRQDIPELLNGSRELRLFMGPFFSFKHTSVDVSRAIIVSWWYLVVTCHRLDYVNNFNSVLAPCLNRCFRDPSIGVLVQQAANILLLLLDAQVPSGSHLEPIAPSPLDLTIPLHCEIFVKYFTLLIRYNPKPPKDNVLIIPIWGRLCDGVKGSPDVKSMLDVIGHAVTFLAPIAATSMIETLNSCPIMTSSHTAELVCYMLKCNISEEKISQHLLKLIRSVSYTEPRYLPIISDILVFCSNAENVSTKSPQYLCKTWEVLSSTLVEYMQQSGTINEGTHIDPQFPTTHNVVCAVFELLGKDRVLPQNVQHSICLQWEALISLYIEHVSQYTTTSRLSDTFVKLIQDQHIDKMLLYPLLYFTKVLVEESPVPQLTLLQSHFSPIFTLVSQVQHIVHTRSLSEGLEPHTLSLCMEMLTSSWGLLTPSQVNTVLTATKADFISLVSADKQYPVAIQNVIQQCYTSLLDNVQKHVTFYDEPVLVCMEEYLIYGLKHTKRLIRVATARFWNSTFGLNNNLGYSDKLRAILHREARRSALIVPNTDNFAVPDTQSQTEISEPTTRDVVLPVKGSFLGKTSAKPVPPPIPVPAKTPVVAKPPPKKQTKTTRSLYKRQIDEDSKECVYISSSPKKQKILTEHQKEKRIEQKLDRSVPVMYNSLDMNSQEPLMFSTDTASQPPTLATPSPTRSPPRTTTTPGSAFNSRKLLFLSPLLKATSAVAKSLALLPTSSPSITSQSSATIQSDSDDELFCDPPESPSQQPLSPEESLITPPSTDTDFKDAFPNFVSPERPLPITPSTAQSLTQDMPSSADEGGESSQDEGAPSSNIVVKMLNIINPAKPNSLAFRNVESSATESSDDALTSKDTTPIDPQGVPSTVSNVPEKLVSCKEYVPTPEAEPQTVVECSQPTDHTLVRVKDFDIPKSPDILTSTAEKSDILEESAVSKPEPDPTILAENSPLVDDIRSILTPSPPPQDVKKELLLPPTLMDFADEISFSNCSTARENAYLNLSANQDTHNHIPRRSSRRLTKRIKSEEYGTKDSVLKFKKIKSEERFPDDVSFGERLQLPTIRESSTAIREIDNMSPLRKSVRARKTSIKLRDDCFITSDIPVSLLIDSSSNSTSGDPSPDILPVTNSSKEHNDSLVILDSQKDNVNPIPVKRKRGRPRRIIEVYSQDLVHEKGSKKTSEITPIVIPDSDSQPQDDMLDAEEILVSLEADISILTKDPTDIADDTTGVVSSSVQQPSQASIARESDSVDFGQTTIDSIPDSQGPSTRQDNTMSLISLESSYKPDTIIHEIPDLKLSYVLKNNSPNRHVPPKNLLHPNACEGITNPLLIEEVEDTQENDVIDLTASESQIEDPQPSKSQRSRPRKQPRPRKSFAPSRKSTRLTSKKLSQPTQNTQESADVIVLDSVSHVSVIIDLSTPSPTNLQANSEMIVPDSLQIVDDTASLEPGINPNHIKDSLKIYKRADSLSTDEASLGDAPGENVATGETEYDDSPEKLPQSIIPDLPTIFSQNISVESQETFQKEPASLPPIMVSDTQDECNDTEEKDETDHPATVDILNDQDSVAIQDVNVMADHCDFVLHSLISDHVDMADKSDTTDSKTMEEEEEDEEEENTPLEVADQLILEPPKQFLELEEFEEPDISVTFCENSQQVPDSVLAPAEKLLDLDSDDVIADSQAPKRKQAPVEKPIVFDTRTKRSLRRKRSIPSNLPDILQDWTEIESSLSEESVSVMDSQPVQIEIKTPPKSLQFASKMSSPHTPTASPNTPSSILKKLRTPGSCSPSHSKRHVTFGPLPDSHRDPNETTPRRISKYNRNSPVCPKPVQPKIVSLAKNVSSEEAIFPSLVHCTVGAQDILRQLSAGFTHSCRNLNMSHISGKNIKSIGDLARLTLSEVEDLPFIAPKQTQLRRHLRKYEASQSPTMAFKSVFSESLQARELLEPVIEHADVVETEKPQKSGEKQSLITDYSDENKENIAPANNSSGVVENKAEPSEDKVSSEPCDELACGVGDHIEVESHTHSEVPEPSRHNEPNIVFVEKSTDPVTDEPSEIPSTTSDAQDVVEISDVSEKLEEKEEDRDVDHVTEVGEDVDEEDELLGLDTLPDTLDCEISEADELLIEDKPLKKTEDTPDTSSIQPDSTPTEAEVTVIKHADPIPQQPMDIMCDSQDVVGTVICEDTQQDSVGTYQTETTRITVESPMDAVLKMPQIVEESKESSITAVQIAQEQPENTVAVQMTSETTRIPIKNVESFVAETPPSRTVEPESVQNTMPDTVSSVLLSSPDNKMSLGPSLEQPMDICDNSQPGPGIVICEDTQQDSVETSKHPEEIREEEHQATVPTTQVPSETPQSHTAPEEIHQMTTNAVIQRNETVVSEEPANVHLIAESPTLLLNNVRESPIHFAETSKNDRTLQANTCDVVQDISKNHCLEHPATCLTNVEDCAPENVAETASKSSTPIEERTDTTAETSTSATEPPSITSTRKLVDYTLTQDIISFESECASMSEKLQRLSYREANEHVMMLQERLFEMLRNHS